jgi:dipeptidyl aminopeptidase/acylaminoacyl peptidase
MIKASIGAGLVLAALLSASAQAAAPEIPAAAFAALPQVTDVELSPDGRLLAWLDESGSRPVVVVFDIAARSYRRTMSIGPAMTLRALRWADDDTLLMNLSEVRTVTIGDGRRRYTYFRTMAFDVVNGATRLLLMSGARAWVTGSDLIAWHTTRPNTVIMSTFDYDLTASSGLSQLSPASEGWVSELFRVDTRTGETTMIDDGGRYWARWVVNAAGDPVARGEWHRESDQFIVDAETAGGWRQILQRSDGQRWTLQALSQDGKSVIATGPGQDGFVRLWAIALDGSGAKDLVPDLSADVVDVIVDRFSGAPVGVDLGDSKVRWLDTAAQARYESVARAFPGIDVAVYGYSQDGSRVLAEVQDRSHPPIYYLVDFNTGHADIVGEAYPALEKVVLGQVRRITYPARDGTAIPAYLTLPPGKTPQGVPMVVLPHGGPEASDTSGFDWMAQFLAVRGYAVLQPEFRGSTGLGEAFRNAGRRQWGGLMQDDVTDGVKAMIREGIADPRRICIVGGSYGGYAALAGAAFTPHLYACAVSINGVSDLPAMLRWEQRQTGPDSDALAYWRTDIGSPFDRNVIDRSPINAAADIEVPVLLLHAVDDTVVPVQQSQNMGSALTRLGKPVTLIELPGEDHWLSKAATRLEVLEDTNHFLRQYLNQPLSQ